MTLTQKHMLLNLIFKLEEYLFLTAEEDNAEVDKVLDESIKNLISYLD